MKETDNFSPEDLCVLCGATVPEGAWVCRACEIRISGKERENDSDIAQVLWGNERKVKILEEYTKSQRKDGNEYP